MTKRLEYVVTAVAAGWDNARHLFANNTHRYLASNVSGPEHVRYWNRLPSLSSRYKSINIAPWSCCRRADTTRNESVTDSCDTIGRTVLRDSACGRDNHGSAALDGAAGADGRDKNGSTRPEHDQAGHASWPVERLVAEAESIMRKSTREETVPGLCTSGLMH